MPYSRPTIGQLRRSANRLMQLGILRSFEPDDEHRPRTYTATTAAGETIVLQREQADGYLRGLAHGSYVEQQREDKR